MLHFFIGFEKQKKGLKIAKRNEVEPSGASESLKHGSLITYDDCLRECEMRKNLCGFCMCRSSSRALRYVLRLFVSFLVLSRQSECGISSFLISSTNIFFIHN